MKKQPILYWIIGIFVLVALASSVVYFGFVRQTLVGTKEGNTIEFKDIKCSSVDDCINRFKAEGVTDADITKTNVVCNNYCIATLK